MNPDFQPAPVEAFVSAIITPFFICSDCNTPMTPTVAIKEFAAGATGVVINCRCNKLWRIGFQTILEVASPPKLATATSIPEGIRTSLNPRDPRQAP